MELSPFLLLTLLVILGGVIAYLGDWLGRKMGKKRLRIMNLRPRHTAILFTVIMGALIPVITAFALIGVSEPVKEWIVRGPALIREVKTLGAERDTLQTEVSTQRKTLESETNKVKELTNENSNLDKENERIKKETSVAAASLKSAQSRVTELRGVETRLKGVNAGLTKTNADLQKRNDGLVSRNSQLDRQARDLGQQTVALSQQVGTLEKDVEDLNTEKERLDRTVDMLKRERAAMDGELFDARSKLITARGELDETKRQLEEAARAFGQLMAGLEAVRESELILRKNEELSRVILPVGLAAAAIRAEIEKLEIMANTAALERGVKPDANDQAAAILDRQRRNPDGTLTTITKQQYIDSFVEAIVKSNEEVVLAAVSFYNYFEDDSGKRPVPLEIGLAFNRLIYKKGDVIATASVDASGTDQELVRFLAEFLNSQVRQSALRNGLLPIYGRNQGIAPVPVSQVSALISRIKQLGGTVILDAIAAGDTKSADMLVLDFKVRRG